MDGPRVLIVSDVPSACERLKKILIEGGCKVAVETHADKASDAVRIHNARVAMLQWRGGSLSALLVGRLMNLWPIPVFCIEPPDDSRALLRALRADAYDVLPENMPEAELMEHVREAGREGELLYKGGRMRLGGYEIAEVLGRGGNGTVYAARELATDRTVAVKVLHPDFVNNKEYVARFTREAKSALRLDHANLMKVYDAGRARSRIFIAMERVEGRPLDVILRNEGNLDPARALRLARQIAEGLAHAHGMGLIHRDIKPSNIVVDSAERVKLLDFGLLKSAFEESTRITQADEFIGTLQYAAPEQLRGERVDNRCDIYSLGVVLYEMLAGARPHPGTDSTQVAFDVAAGKTAVPLQKINQTIGPKLSVFVHTLLSPIQVLRPTNAQDVVAKIDEFIANPWA